MKSRLVNPEIFRDVVLAKLSPRQRLLVVGLPTMADREGRMEDCPERIRIDLFPFDDDDLRPDLDVLADVGYIHRYEVEGRKYFWMPTFAKYQRPHPREAASTTPPHPAEGLAKDTPRTNPAQTQDTPRSPVSDSAFDPISKNVSVCLDANQDADLAPAQTNGSGSANSDVERAATLAKLAKLAKLQAMVREGVP
ncbi:hypothetical protein AB4059_01515 [Lysobacter sp. 2RAF19]